LRYRHTAIKYFSPFLISRFSTALTHHASRRFADAHSGATFLNSTAQLRRIGFTSGTLIITVSIDEISRLFQ